MYKKGSALELQFSPARLNDGAGDPFWIDLTASEAERLLAALQARLSNGAHVSSNGTDAPIVFNLDSTTPESADEAAQRTDARVHTEVSSDEFRQWVCVICGWIYDEAAGCPEDGLAPGTRWAEVPDDWRCPLCDVGKTDFALVEF